MELEQMFHLGLERQRGLCEKAYKRIFRQLSTNGGPWSIVGNEEHWKASHVLDQSFRRIYLKPNMRFDLHKQASLLRDEATAAQAQEKFQIWRAVSGTSISPAPELFKIEAEFDERNYEFSTHAVLITVMASVSKRENFMGTFYMNHREICFNVPHLRSIRFGLADLEMVLLRSYLHIDTGLEFFLASRRSYFFDFALQDRTRILGSLKNLSLPNLKLLQTNWSKDLVGQFTDKWNNGALSNYEYLLMVNLLAGRSFNDLSQYPVFPWILSNYEPDSLDLNNPSNYRDLALPLGVMNTQRWESIVVKLGELPENDPNRGTFFMQHYSNPFYVSLYLIRVEPFTSLHIELCDEKFDKSDRLFWSVARSWENVTSIAPDYRELIPEFFTFPEFLINANGFDLAASEVFHSKRGDVLLPPWARDSPHEFIEIHRQALESPYVSSNLNKWIDLIFGYKQSGIEAIAARNTFYPGCYQSSMTAEVLADPDWVSQVQAVAQNVGIAARQLFPSAHPTRNFLPRIPSFVGFSRVVLFPLRTPPVTVHLAGNVLYFMIGSCDVYSITIPKIVKGRPPYTRIGTVQNYVMALDITPRSFLLIPEIGRFIAGTPLDSCFHVFGIDSNSIWHSESFRQPFSLLSTLNYAGSSFLLTSWRDSSLILWNLAKVVDNLIYRTTPHVASIVDVEANANLRLIASLDKSRKCVLSMLDSGSFVRSFVVDGTDSLQKILLFSHGFIAILSAVELPASKKSVIRLYGLDARKIGNDLVFHDGVSSWCKLEYDCGLYCLAVAFTSTRLLFLRISDLSVLADQETLHPIVALNFSSEDNRIVLTTSDGTISLGRFSV
jgi:hypothetical protein